MTSKTIDTKKELTRYLLEKVKQRDLDPKLAIQFLKEIESVSLPRSNKMEPFAIIGLSCRFPHANDPDELWDNLASGRNSIRAFPPARMEDFRRNGGDIRKRMQYAGFLDSVDAFDPEYFNIPPRTAVEMDPYHRLMLQVFVEAIEYAGYHRGQLQGRRIGVFVGNDHTHRYLTSYLSFLSTNDFKALTGSWTGVLASRLSYLLNLRGPAMVLDTSCSSSLVALDVAIKSILHGDCEEALVGGVNLIFTPDSMESDVQSADFMIRAFDKRAGGTNWGEGVAAVLIKPLSKALEDRDHIHGVIRGIAVNNDGTTNGITAPNARAQQEVIESAWKQAGISPDTISYIETHGTGTNLGDPIEIKGITSAFAKYTSKRQFCSIGSIKTNIGHTVGVAGLASLIKVLLALREKALPPSLHFTEPNPLIDFCNSPVYVQDCLTEWPAEEAPRRAGVSSFSISGTNSHVVVEEAPLDERKEIFKGWRVFPLSGRTPELLQKTAIRYARYLRRHQNLRWEDICFTACTGREHHPVRAVVLCRDTSGIVEGLEALVAVLADNHSEIDKDTHTVKEGKDFTLFIGSQKPTSTGSAKHSHSAVQKKEELAKKIASSLAESTMEDLGEWHRLSTLYTGGVEIDFERLFQRQAVNRCPLPPQAFKDQRYWDEAGRKPLEIQSSLGEANEDEMTATLLWEQAQAGTSRLSAASEDRVKIFVAWVWSEVLGYPLIHDEDDYLDLGGDSVHALRVIQTINFVFNVDLPLSILMETSVFDRFVRRLHEEFGITEDKMNAQKGEKEGTHHSLVNNENQSPFFLSSAQKRMFLTANMMPNSLAYNVTEVIRLEKTETFDRVQSLLRMLIARHESLRTSFHMDKDTTPIQVIHPQVEFNIERRLLQDEEGKNRVEIVQEELKKFIRPFDLSKAPLVRAGYLEFNDHDSYLVIDMHHIITDGTSMGVFISDYQSLAEGRSLPPLTFGYRDAVSWFLSRQSEFHLRKQGEWWQKQFADGIPVLNLPTDSPRPVTRDYRGSRVFHTLSTELNHQVKALAKRSGVTLFMVLIATFHNLLARLGADRDTVIGTPVAGRPRLELQKVMGMFVNTLPLRLRSNADEQFLAFLERVRKNVVEAYDNQDYPYELLIEDLKPERIPGRNPLFDVYFGLQNIDMGLPEDVAGMVSFESGSAKFDLTVTARETTDSFLMEWEYSEALFHRESVEQMAQRFELMLTSIVEDPTKRLGEIELISEKERVLLLEEWNQTTAPFPGKRGIVSLFEEWVASQGDAEALLLDDQRMSYQELNSRSNKIAHGILQTGTGPGSAVALLMNRSFDMIAAILGVLKAGCYFIPLDIGSPTERLVTMLKDGDAKLLVTHQELANRRVGEISKLILDTLDSELPEHNLEIEASGEEPAYIVYTSGSTGTPKGILIRQEGVIRVVRDNGYLVINPQDVLLQLSNYSFDGAIFDIFGALLNGASLVLVHKHEVADPRVLGERIRDNNVSIFFITTALFNALVDASPECFDNTRAVLFGGEAASIHHVRQAFKRLGPERLIHVYGPTETTVFATYLSIVRDPENKGLPIGRAIGNTSLYVLDEHMRLQPIGVPGELYIGGPGLAVEYLNQPHLTAERFVENPFKSGERLYRSGDLVAWGKDGYLRYLGRRDQQVKLRGFRIELAEIEANSVCHSSVREAHAGIFVDDRNGRTLSLWVVPEKSMAVFDEQALRQALNTTLPEYMVPTFIIPVTALPLNKNGKIDKAQLPGPLLNREELQEPRNEYELLLARIWTDVLGIHHIGINDNFFVLGGDSIKAIQVIARIQSAGLNLDMEKMFEHQTIKALAPYLEKRVHVEAEQGEVSGPCIPSPIQSWFLHSTDLPNHFCQAMWISMRESFQWEQLESALNRLCHHHDALRLVVSSNGMIRLKSLEEGKLYDLTHLPPNLNKDTLKEKLIEIQSHIDLRNGPIVAAAMGSDREEGQLFLAIHHMAVDVVSWSTILDDLLTLLSNPETSLPRKTMPFPAWTQSLDEWARKGGAIDELPYWMNLAQESLALSAPFVAEKVLHRDTVSVKHWIDGDTGRALCGEANQAYHTETVHLVLLVLARTLEKWTRTSGMLINLEGHGREAFDPALDVSRTVGWFTSTFPILLQGSGEIGEAVKAVKESIRSVPRRGFGFGILRSLTPDLSPEAKKRLESIRPSISFNYLGVQDGLSSSGAEVEVLPAEVTIDGSFETSWVLDIVASQVDSALCLDIRYPRTFFTDIEFNSFRSLLDDTAIEVIDYCSDRTGEKTASDFTVTPLQQAELENILLDLDIKDERSKKR